MTNEIVNVLEAFEPERLAALRDQATTLELGEHVLRKQLGERKQPRQEDRGKKELENHIEVVATLAALQTGINTSAETLDALRKRVEYLDQLRLIAEVLAAITGFFSASGVADLEGTRVLAGIACLGAILSALLPRLSTSNASLKKAWSTHYSELVQAIAQADIVRRKLGVWIAKYEAKEALADPSKDVEEANELCNIILEKYLITSRRTPAQRG